MSVSDGRLHATTSVYSTCNILANTAYQAMVSGLTGFRTDSFTPGGHSLQFGEVSTTNLWANLEID